MFGRKKSMRGGNKDLTVLTTSSSPEPAAAAAAVVVAPPRPVVTKKVEVPKKPAGPKSIVPPGTKRLLVVGKYVVMNADVRDCDAVIVEGNLDGNIKAKYVVIVKGGCMRGKVECQEAEVAGSFEGMEMIVRHRLTLSSSARVGGKTTYNRLMVHEGAILTGELQYKPSSRTRSSSSSPKAGATTPPAPVEIAPPAVTRVAPEEEQGDSTSAPLNGRILKKAPTEEEDSTQ